MCDRCPWCHHEKCEKCEEGQFLEYGFSDIGAYWFGDMTVPYPDIRCSIELGMNFRSRWASGVRKSEI